MEQLIEPFYFLKRWAFFIAAFMTIVPFITDRKEGFWNRTILAGVSFREMLISQTIVYSGVVLLLYIEIIVYAGYVYQTTNYQSYLTLFILLASLGLSGMFMGIGLSTICPNVTSANMLMIAISLSLCIVSGVVIPVENMCLSMKRFARCLPIVYVSEAIRDIMVKGFSFADRSVQIGFGVTFIWMIIGVSLGTWVLKMRKFSRNT